MARKKLEVDAVTDLSEAIDFLGKQKEQHPKEMANPMTGQAMDLALRWLHEQLHQAVRAQIKGEGQPATS